MESTKYSIQTPSKLSKHSLIAKIKGLSLGAKLLFIGLVIEVISLLLGLMQNRIPQTGISLILINFWSFLHSVAFFTIILSIVLLIIQFAKKMNNTQPTAPAQNENTQSQSVPNQISVTMTPIQPDLTTPIPAQFGTPMSNPPATKKKIDPFLIQGIILMLAAPATLLFIGLFIWGALLGDNPSDQAKSTAAPFNYVAVAIYITMNVIGLALIIYAFSKGYKTRILAWRQAKQDGNQVAITAALEAKSSYIRSLGKFVIFFPPLVLLFNYIPLLAYPIPSLLVCLLFTGIGYYIIGRSKRLQQTVT